jgi:hypothetical protein
MPMFTQEEIRKHRCRNGAYGTLERIKRFSAEDIIMNTFIKPQSDVAYAMAKRYEYMLVLAKTDSNKYIQKRDQLHLDLAKWIKDNKYYREFVDLIYFVTYTLDGSSYRIIADAYLSEMMETWNYLTGYRSEEVIYGLTSTNELLLAPDYYGDWDIPVMKLNRDLERRKITPQQFKEKFFQLSKEFVTERNENLADIAIFNMIPFINERTKAIYPKDWFPHAEQDKLEFPRVWKPTEFYREQLRSRKFIIDRKGVKVFLRNAGSFNEILFMEDFTKDKKIIMLFRLSTPEGSTQGYYHLQDEQFFTAFKYSDGQHIHDSIENLVLEVYTEIVCGLEKDRKRLYAIQEVEDIDNIPDYKDTHLYVQYQLYNHESDRDELKGRRKGFHQRPHERRFALRKLRENQKPSDEAIERARELGIELQEGYTFVRAYSVGLGVKDIRKEL